MIVECVACLGVLLRECGVVRSQLGFLYDNEHAVGSELLERVGDTWSWLARIDRVVNDSAAIVKQARLNHEQQATTDSFFVSSLSTAIPFALCCSTFPAVVSYPVVG